MRENIEILRKKEKIKSVKMGLVNIVFDQKKLCA